jgi:ferrous iron transport protein B
MYHTISRLKSFLFRAGRVIIIIVAILSLLNSMGTDGSFGNQDSGNSILSAMGRAASPVLYPMGINGDNWPASVGLITGIFAKEAVVGTLDNLYGSMTGELRRNQPEVDFSFSGGIAAAFKAIPEGFSVTAEDERPGTETGTFDVMRSRFNGWIGAYAYLLFILIYSPCVAVIAVIRKETNTGWAVFSTVYLTILAWTVSTLFYRTATIMQSPLESALWIAAAAAVLSGIWITLKLLAKNSSLRV